MLCSEFETRLQLLLDQRRSPERDASLQRHAGQCPACRDRMATCIQALEALELLEVPELPADFAQRVVDAVVGSSPRPKSPPPRDSSWLVAAAVALTMLLAAVPIVWQSLSSSHSVAQPNLQDPSSQQRIATSEPQQQPLPDELDASWFVSSSILELYPEAVRERHRQQVHQIADDLRPIATPFNATMTAIRRSLPGTKSSDKGEPRASLRRQTTGRQIS